MCEPCSCELLVLHVGRISENRIILTHFGLNILPDDWNIG